MKKLIGLFCTLALFASCKPKLPDLILERHFFVDKEDFMPEFGLRSGDLSYSTPDGMYSYNPEKEELTLFSELGIAPEHQEILEMEPEIIDYPDLFSYGLRGESRFICFSHQYNLTRFKRVTESKPVAFENCKKTIGLPYQKFGWGDIAAFILLILNKSEEDLVNMAKSIH